MAQFDSQLWVDPNSTDNFIPVGGQAPALPPRLPTQHALSSLDAHVTLQELLREASPAIQTKRLSVSLRLLAKNHYFVGDGDRARNVIRSLLSSAIASAPTGGHMTVRSTRPADCALRIEIEEHLPWRRPARASQPTRPPRARK